MTQLTEKQSDLLKYLESRQGQETSYDTIAQALNLPTGDSVRTHIAALKKKGCIMRERGQKDYTILHSDAYEASMRMVTTRLEALEDDIRGSISKAGLPLAMALGVLETIKIDLFNECTQEEE